MEGLRVDGNCVSSILSTSLTVYGLRRAIYCYRNTFESMFNIRYYRPTGIACKHDTRMVNEVMSSTPLFDLGRTFEM